MTPGEQVKADKERIQWMMNHPLWERDQHGVLHLEVDFRWCVSFEPVFVNPATDEIDDDESKNTDLHVWIEAGPPYLEDAYINQEGTKPFIMHSHDLDLDCGAKTLHQALLQLADLVEKHYNADGSKKAEETHV